MAGDWIKMCSNLAETEEVIGMAETLDCDEDLIVGKLHRIWSWADQITTNGEVKVSLRWINRYVGLEGFADAMIGAGWLLNNGDHLVLPSYEKHNGNCAKKRASDAKRAANKRVSQKSRKNVASDATKSGPTEEKRREEKRRDNNNNKSSASGPSLSEVVEAWNIGAPQDGRIADIAPGSGVVHRFELIRSNPDFIDQWRFVLDYVRGDPNYGGQNKTGWQATLHWFLSGEGFSSTLARAHAYQHRQAKQQTGDTTDIGDLL